MDLSVSAPPPPVPRRPGAAGNDVDAQVRRITQVAKAVAAGDLGRKAAGPMHGEMLALQQAVNTMVDQLRTLSSAVTRAAQAVDTQGGLAGQVEVPGAAGEWRYLTDSVNQLLADLAVARFSRLLQERRDLSEVARAVLSELAPLVGAHRAQFYALAHEAGGTVLRQVAGHGQQGERDGGKTFALGQGLVGQCAQELRRILLTSRLPAAVGEATGLPPTASLSVLVVPVAFEGRVHGVLELASSVHFSTAQLALLEPLAESVGQVLHSLAANTRTEQLLAQSQSLAQELQNRQRELQHTNRALKDKARLLALRNQEVERKNREVEQARQALEDKATQLAQTSRYKSEFLANMSHELRTPLNSLLILSEQLSRNAEGNLNQRQVEFARTIHAAGNDLLTLINDILDLSKIESGTVAVDAGELRLSDLQRYVERTFRPVAEAQGVEFVVDCRLRASVTVVTDAKRLQQILKNLLSNAFKFTDHGQVRLSITQAQATARGGDTPGRRARRVLAFEVSDSGIGIPPEKQKIIFEAFQQADGSTSRKYGGTGLGLAISRELARLLGGEIHLDSEMGRGSTFTLHLPLRRASTRGPRRVAATALAASHCVSRAALSSAGQAALFARAEPAAEAVGPSDAEAPLLVVEQDARSAARIVRAARALGLPAQAVRSGAAALALAGRGAASAIVLGRELGGMPAARLVSRLENDPALRHLPLCRLGVSGMQGLSPEAFLRVAAPCGDRRSLMAALQALHAFLQRPHRRLLVGMAEGPRREDFLALLEPGQVWTTVAESPQALPVLLAAEAFDAVALDAAWLAHAGDPLRQALANAAGRIAPLRLPVLCLYRAQEPPETEPPPAPDGACSWHLADTASDLFDQAWRCLHGVVAGLPLERRALLQSLAAARRPLAGMRALVVDDDMRNIFAMASVLEEQGMDVTWADNGHDAIRRITEDAGISVVLMDIMMPEFDGLAALRAIRRLPRARDLPLIAVTAKAMQGDRDKCIEAGAWDYLAKPLRTQDLLQALRAWRWP